MADGALLTFGVQRNEDYSRLWRFRALGDTDGIDITGWTFSFRVNSAAGLSGMPLLEVSSTETLNGSVLRVTDAVHGDLTVIFKQADVAALPGRPSDIVPFAFNMLATDGAGIRRANVRGLFIVEPGV
jgi:hypothetical protein